jgi:hypothetical protein
MNMNNVRILLIGFTTVLATILGGSTIAHAQRHMLVLIDASGSMTTPRVNDAQNPTRFDAAKARAKSQITDQARQGLDAVAVYTFSDFTATPQTAGFVDPNVALSTITGLDLFTVGGGNTPLAGSVCDAVDVLVADAAPTKILGLTSDGEENSTPVGHNCQGPFSTTGPPNYSNGSWQQLVTNYVVDHNINVYVDLFNPGPIISLAARASIAAADPEAEITAKTRLIAAVAAIAAGDEPPTLEEFFDELARESGGRLTIDNDDAPQLPVFADFNGNSCVDRSDALLVARAFGHTGLPQDNPLDLNADGKVGFADYALALGAFTPGGCGTADPYVPRAPVVCHGGAPVVIDGKSIEGGGITIDVHGVCAIVIKNSLIVSGQNAIKILGTAVVTVDNSVIVGENAVLSSQGVTFLSAANSVFHGARNITGAFVLVDRGGNTFE